MTYSINVDKLDDGRFDITVTNDLNSESSNAKCNEDDLDIAVDLLVHKVTENLAYRIHMAVHENRHDKNCWVPAKFLEECKTRAQEQIKSGQPKENVDLDRDLLD